MVFLNHAVFLLVYENYGFVLALAVKSQAFLLLFNSKPRSSPIGPALATGVATGTRPLCMTTSTTFSISPTDGSARRSTRDDSFKHLNSYLL